MKRTSLSIAAALASVIAGAGMNAVVTGAPGGGLEVSAPSAKNSPAKVASAWSERMRTIGQFLGFDQSIRRPAGKRYRASIRQHQRHALKARNKARSRR